MRELHFQSVTDVSIAQTIGSATNRETPMGHKTCSHAIRLGLLAEVCASVSLRTS